VNVQDVLTLIVAIAALWAAFEAFRSRRDLERDRDARAIRDALLELADALRRWRKWYPVTGGIVSGTPDQVIVLPRVTQMLARVTFREKVLAYLLWSTDAVRVISTGYLDVIFDRIPQIGNPSGEPYQGWGTVEGQDLWWATLERIVDTASVTMEEARRRGFAEIAAAFEPLFNVDAERHPSVTDLFLVEEVLPPAPPHP